LTRGALASFVTCIFVTCIFVTLSLARTVSDRLLADAVVVLHLAFIVFALTGGALVLRWSRVAWLHLPAVAWAAYVEFTAAICPLTPLENALRHRAGQAGYAGGFVEHYVVPLIYPPGLTPAVQATIGAIVLTINAAIYAFAWTRRDRGCAHR
jgi:hypothetical protein